MKKAAALAHMSPEYMECDELVSVVLRSSPLIFIFLGTPFDFQIFVSKILYFFRIKNTTETNSSHSLYCPQPL